ncbi:hypothetical protein G7Z17_g13458 [Cylindrodendrum hubeiense]|uniref:Pectate lyase n=1 Tax=Cylindrodendrum hubeiense TaxID=595255 RepID=A0A9P5L9A4_9HYPO|nr:hypothetical protein G7Z17_g13458 [Cylindrodendrum hubeiense]
MPSLLKITLFSASLVSAAITNTELQTAIPASSGTTDLAAVQTIAAGESFDGEMLLWDRNPSTCAGQTEGGDADAVFILEDGATLSNVLIGPNNGEGVHCLGSCTINNVWFTDVCEDAMTFKQVSGTSFVNGGGAAGADDKVLQHNGGGTLAVKNFLAQNVGKVYRSCGNCDEQSARLSTFTNIRVEGAKVVAGVNGNLGDSTTIEDSCLVGVDSVCDLFEGNDTGDEPSQTASAPDGTTCATSGVTLDSC